MPAAACIPAGRATSRCLSTSGCICSGRIPQLQANLRGLIATLTDQAERAGDALMPSYTHMRRAMPVLVAHFLLEPRGRAAPRSRASGASPRAKPMRCRLDRGPSPAPPTRSTCTRWPHASGFSRVVANSMDASSDRDFAATFVYACALTMVHLSRIAEDFILLRRRSLGFSSSTTGRPPAAA